MPGAPAEAVLAAAALVLVLSGAMLACGAPTYSSYKDVRPAGNVIEARNSTFVGPREEARALCSVRTPEGNASANVTISRRLHGVLTPKEMHTAIQRLEVVIHGQLQHMWQTLEAIRVQLPAAPGSFPSAGPASPAAIRRDRNKFVYRYYVPGGAAG